MCQVLECYNRQCGHRSRYRLLTRCPSGFSFAARSCKGNNNRIVAYRPLSYYRSCAACNADHSEMLQRVQKIYAGEIQEQAEREGWNRGVLVKALKSATSKERQELLNTLVALRGRNKELSGGLARFESEHDEGEYVSDADIDSDSEGDESQDPEDTNESDDGCHSPSIEGSPGRLRQQGHEGENDGEIKIDTMRPNELPHLQYIRNIHRDRKPSNDSIDIETPRKRTHDVELVKITYHESDVMDICDSSETSGEEAHAENDEDESEADIKSNCDLSENEPESGGGI